MSDKRDTDNSWLRGLQATRTEVMQALSEMTRKREASPGISVADPLAGGPFDLSGLPSDAPGRFPGIGNVGDAGDNACIDGRHHRASRQAG